MVSKSYGVRYFVQEWGKPAELVKAVRVAPGINVNGVDIGYADAVFLASIIRQEGKPPSVLLLDSDSGNSPTREMLLLIKEM